jgi:hypothetical protein
VYLKKSELILRPIGSAGGIPPEPPFRPPRLEAEAKRTISSFSFRFLRNSGLRPVWRQILFFNVSAYAMFFAHSLVILLEKKGKKYE